MRNLVILNSLRWWRRQLSLREKGGLNSITTKFNKYIFYIFSLEDSANIVITWGKLKLKVTESRTSLYKEYNNQNDEYKTNKKEKKIEKMDDCIISEEGKQSKYNAMKNQKMCCELKSKNEKNVQNDTVADSNNVTKSSHVNNKNKINGGKCENEKNVDKTIRSNTLHMIDENYSAGEEVIEGWTNITINKSKKFCNNTGTG